jgi:uncharacterized protein (TIGR02217 family)
MSGFRDVYLPDQVRGFPFVSSPRFNTTITTIASGAEQRNQNWVHPLHRFSAPEGVKCHEAIEDLRDHWMIMRGPAFSFPFRDPMDFASRHLVKANLEPSLFITDQVIGIGDDVTRTFQLKKTYTRDAYSYERPIYLPVVETVILGINAVAIADVAPISGGPYTADVVRDGGEVIFDHAPRAGDVITAGFLFDVEIRFEGDDALDAVVQSFQTSGFADLSFWEVRHCAGEQSS